MKTFVCHHFLGDRGDPGFKGGLCVVKQTRSGEAALAWGLDRLERPIYGDRHPGRVLIEAREGRGHGVSADIWISPRDYTPAIDRGPALVHEIRVDVLAPEIWGSVG